MVAARLLLVFVCILACVKAAQAQVLPPALQNQQKSLSGVYAGTDAGSCCWLGPHAAMLVAAPGGGADLVVKLLVPDYAVREGQLEALQIRVSDKAPVAYHLARGYHELSLPLDPGISGNVLVTIDAAPAFVPERLHINADTRELSVLLRDIRVVPRSAPWWKYALLLAALVATLAAVLRRPIVAPIGILLSAPFSFVVPIGATSISLQTVIMGAAVIALGINLRSRFVLGDAAFVAFILALGAWLGFVLLDAAHYPGAAASDEAVKALQYLVTFVVASAAFFLDTSTRAIRNTLTAAVTLVSVCALAQLVTGAPESIAFAHLTFSRIAGPLEGPNQLCAFLALCIPVLVVLRPRGRHALGFYAILAVGVAACVLTFSRGGILQLLVAAALAVVFTTAPAYRRWAVAGAGALFALLFGLSMLAFAGSAHAPQALFGSAAAFNGGLGTRMSLYHAADVLWRQSPWLGVGPGNFEASAGIAGIAGVQTHANSYYFQTLAETGIAGFAIALALVWLPLNRFYAYYSDPLVAGILASGIGLAVHDVIDDLVFYPKVGIIWFALAGIGYAACAHIGRRALTSQA